MIYDLVIVGGGLVGLEVIRRLQTSARFRTLIIEPGSSSAPSPGYNSSFRYQGKPPVKSVFGGRSGCWEGVCLPLEKTALALWPPLIRENLISQVIGSYFRQAIQLNSDDYFMFGGSSLDAFTLSLRSGFQFVSVPLAAKKVNGALHSYSPYPWAKTILTDKNRFSVFKGWCDRIYPKQSRFMVDCVDISGSRYEVEAAKVLICAGGVQSCCVIADYFDIQSNSVSISDHLAFGTVVRLPKNSTCLLTERGFFYHPMAFNEKGNAFIKVTETEHYIELDAWLICEPFDLPTQHVDLCRQTRFAAAIQVDLSHAVKHLADKLDELLCLIEPQATRLIRSSALRRPTTFDDAIQLMNAYDPESECCFHYVQPLGAVDHEGAVQNLDLSIDDQFTINGQSQLHAIGTFVFPSLGHANPSFTLLCLANQFAEQVS